MGGRTTYLLYPYSASNLLSLCPSSSHGCREDLTLKMRNENHHPGGITWDYSLVDLGTGSTRRESRRECQATLEGRNQVILIHGSTHNPFK